MTATYAKFTLQLNTVTDADVIEYLNAQANKNDTIRRALRARMGCDQVDWDEVCSRVSRMSRDESAPPSRG